MAQFLKRPGTEYEYINSDATTQIHEGECILHRIVINGGTLTGTITIIDGTDGSTANVATIAANQVGGTVYEYNAQMSSGLRIITSAAVDITVVYQV